MKLDEILKHDNNFRLLLLGRMVNDCKYYLGNGNRHTKDLWALDETTHINYMRAIYDSLPEDRRPKWASPDVIDDFAFKMIGADINMLARDFEKVMRMQAKSTDSLGKQVLADKLCDIIRLTQECNYKIADLLNAAVDLYRS